MGWRSMPDQHPGSEQSDTPALHVAYDGTLGQPWTVVVRLWDAATTAWRGLATVGQIASSPEHAVELVRKNGPWPEGTEFIAHPPGDPLGAVVWEDTHS